jgi:hypothetical protein
MPDPGCPKTFRSRALLLLFLDRFSHAARVLGTYQSETGPMSVLLERETAWGMTRAPAWLDYCDIVGGEV